MLSQNLLLESETNYIIVSVPWDDNLSMLRNETSKLMKIVGTINVNLKSDVSLVFLYVGDWGSVVDYVVHLHAVRTGEKKSAFAFEGAEEERATEDCGKKKLGGIIDWVLRNPQVCDILMFA